jgi:hypothetical protein
MGAGACLQRFTGCQSFHARRVFVGENLVQCCEPVTVQHLALRSHIGYDDVSRCSVLHLEKVCKGLQAQIV